MIEDSRFVKVDPETGVVITRADIEPMKQPGEPTVKPVVDSPTQDSTKDTTEAPVVVPDPINQPDAS